VRAAFPKGNLYVDLRTEFGTLYDDQLFADLYADHGRPFRKTIEDVEKEVALSERGGQVRRDIERLYEDSDGIPVRIYIGDIPHPVAVRIAPTRTRFFGVLPKDVNPSLIGKELADTKVSFEIIGVDISQRELRAVADRLAPLAERMLAAPP
jgi:hypothetical protein